jgi:thioredoxin:protein disulfide reductase
MSPIMALFLSGLLLTLGIPHLLFALTSDKNAQKIPEVKVWTLHNTIQVEHAKPATVSFSVQIPPNHHGYLDRGDEGFLIPFSFSFSQLEEHGVLITPLSRPPGERDEAVRATILRGTGEFIFRFAMQDFIVRAPASLPVKLQYQICNDLTNICYAPREATLPLHFSRAQAEVATPPLPPLTLNEQITELFRRYMTNLFFACGLIFVIGLLATATPCVYPMLPLTSAFLMARGKGSSWYGSLHVLLYGLGIVFFYMLLGVIAATTGTALSSIMTSAWTNLGFAILFTYFGCSMLGLCDFEFFLASLTKLDAASGLVQGFQGSFLMGTVVGLVVSPCVGPVTGTILLDIAQQTATLNLSGNPLSLAKLARGILMMTSFGAGLAIPFLLVGTVSHRFPHSGTWLTTIKFLLGFPILYFAYTYYIKGMETAGISTNVTHAILLGMLAVVGGVFIGAWHTIGDKPSANLLLRRAVGIILLIIGIHFLYNGIGESGILIQPRALITGKTGGTAKTDGEIVSAKKEDSGEVHGNLYWSRDFTLAQQRSQTEQKPLFVDFYATWCANCRAFQNLTLKNVALNQALHKAILVKIYDTDPFFAVFQQNPHYPELRGVGGQPLLPLFAIYSPQGVLTWKGQDYQAVNTIIAQLAYAQNTTTP